MSLCVDRMPSIEIGTLLDRTGYGLVVANREGLILQVNRVIVDWTAQPSDKLIGTSWLDSLLAPSARAYFIGNIADPLKSRGRVLGIHIGLESAAGQLIPAVLSAHIAKEAGGDQETTYLIFQRTTSEDALQNHLSETHGHLQSLEQDLDIERSRVRQANAALRAYAAAAAALTRAQSRSDLLTNICLGIAHGERYAAVAFVLLRPEGASVEVMSGPYQQDFSDYISSLLKYSDHDGLLRSNATEIVTDTQQERRLQTLRRAHARLGIRSLISVPVELPSQATARSILLVCASEPNAFAIAEAEIFERLASEITFGLKSLATSKALKVERSRIASVIEHAPVPIIVCDAEGRIMLFNKEACTAFGYAADEVLAKPLDLFLRMENADSTESGWAVASRELQQTATPLKAEALRKDGGTFPAELTPSIADGEDERLTTIIVRNLSEQRISQDRLMKSARMEAFGQLASGIAHDFNNILATIHGNAEILEASMRPDDDLAKFPASILASCDVATDLIRQLLIFARGSTSEASAIDACAAVREMAPILKQAAGKAISFSLSTLCDSAWIRADKSLLQTSLLNLVLNARHAINMHGRINVSMKLAPSDNHESELQISVADTGSGIPPEVLGRIFEPFFTTKSAGRGTGLGLAMVHGFVSHAGGTIAVASEVGKGSTFTLHFPVTAPPTLEVRSPPEKSIGKAEMHVLVVEDSQDLLEVLTERLERMQCKVTPFAEPVAALEWAKQNDFDVLCSDYHLNSEMTGTDLAREVAQIKPGTGIIIVSGNLDPVSSGTMAPEWVSLQKPVRKDALLSAILGLQKLRAESRSAGKPGALAAEVRGE